MARMSSRGLIEKDARVSHRSPHRWDHFVWNESLFCIYRYSMWNKVPRNKAWSSIRVQISLRVFEFKGPRTKTYHYSCQSPSQNECNHCLWMKDLDLNVRCLQVYFVWRTGWIMHCSHESVSCKKNPIKNSNRIESPYLLCITID